MQKRDIQPFISTSTKNIINKLSFITGYSVKQIGEDLCTRALRNKDLGNDLSSYFKREMKINNTVYQPIEKPLKEYPVTGDLERVSVKISLQAYEFVYSLAHALGWSAAKVVAYCIERTMKDFDFLNFYITKFLNNKIDDNRRELLLLVMKDINKELDEEHSIASLLLGIVDEIKEADQNVTEAVSQIVGKW